MAAAKRKRKKKISPFRVVIILILAALIVFCAYSVKNIIELHLEQKELKETNAELTQKKDDLIAELKNVNDLEYIEEQARKQLKMIKPGEVLYVIDEGDGDGSSEDGQGTKDASLQSDAPQEAQPQEGAEPEDAGQTEAPQDEAPQDDTAQDAQDVPEG